MCCSAPHSNAVPCSRCAFPPRHGKGRPACIARRRRGYGATSLFCHTAREHHRCQTTISTTHSRMLCIRRLTISQDTPPCECSTGVQFAETRASLLHATNCFRGQTKPTAQNAPMLFCMLFQNRHAIGFAGRTVHVTPLLRTIHS